MDDINLKFFINKSFSYAIIGATNNQDKYGYKVLKDLNDAGFKVIPINPNEKEILGLKVFASVNDVDADIDVAVLIVPPVVTEKVLNDILKKGIKKVWFQPGSESENALYFCRQHGIKFISGMCIMIKKHFY